MPTSPQTVALTGATGFVGRHVLPRLLVDGHRVRALVRDPDKLGANRARVEAIQGDLFNQAACTELVRGADAVIHLVGIIAEEPSLGQTFQRVHVDATRNLLDATIHSGAVKRWVHMSALGARHDSQAQYQQTKAQAEDHVRASGIPWTIFRPSIIHGHDGEFMQMVKSFVCSPVPPFIPYFCQGVLPNGPSTKLQPVWVEDVASCFVGALSNPRTIGENYPLGGPDALTWPELYLACQRHLPGARPWKKTLGIPACVAMCLSSMPGAPFNADQVLMSQEDSTCQIAKAEIDLGVRLAPFEETFAAYAKDV